MILAGKNVYHALELKGLNQNDDYFNKKIRKMSKIHKFEGQSGQNRKQTVIAPGKQWSAIYFILKCSLS